MKEIWKDIEGYEGLYMVSNKSRIKSCARTVKTKDQKEYQKSELILSQSNSDNGYIRVTLYDKNKKPKSHFAHRIVASAFIENEKSLPCVNHINGIKDDNRIENLEWVSLGENVKHGWKNRPNRKRRGRRVYAINIKTGERIDFDTMYDAKKEGFVISCISGCIDGVYSQHKGYKWYDKPRKSKDIEGLSQAYLDGLNIEYIGNLSQIEVEALVKKAYVDGYNKKQRFELVV